MFLTAFKDILWPRACLACGLTTTDPILCDGCKACSDRAPEPDAAEDGPVHSAVAVWKFDRDEPIRYVLHRLKYGNCPWIGLPLGAGLAASTNRSGAAWDVVVPVPLHPRRLLERGYNQAEWIARGLAREMNLPIEPFALARRKNTRTQTGLSREDRPSNVNNAFAVDEGDRISGANVLLVDDTLTTGATLSEASRMLVAGGVSTVLPVAVAFATLRLDEEQRAAGSVISSRHQPTGHESPFLGHHL